MASGEHIDLSDFIKSVHQKLREDTKILGAEEAWQKHCRDEVNLEKYATAMKNLATKYWDNNSKRDHKVTSRVEWIHHFCKSYFCEKEIFKYREKEVVIAQKIALGVGEIEPSIGKGGKLEVLDVGSCYNPLKIYPCFDVTPIDIAPANSDVYKCDFLNLKLASYTVSHMSDSEITELQKDSFDVIVFSLLLEYLPSPIQRYACCEKAYNLLKPEGILIIVTPDSKHVGANAKIMKSWRFLLAKLGFSRIFYEKLSYLHCMVFRRSLWREVPQRWVALQNETQFFQEMVIPQDFKKIVVPHCSSTSEEICDVTLFNELPCISGE